MEGLMTHCGAKGVSMDALERIKYPKPTETWVPIPHHKLMRLVEGEMGKKKLEVAKRWMATSKDSRVFFAVLDLRPNKKDEIGLMVGLRNSVDKSMPAGLCFGSRVFVCDNMAFSGEIVIKRRHTKNILNDLPGMVQDAVGRLPDALRSQERVYTAMRSREVSSADMDEMIVSLVRKDVLPGSLVQKVAEAVHKDDRTSLPVWDGFNAVTAAMRDRFLSNPIVSSNRTMVITDAFSEKWELN